MSKKTVGHAAGRKHLDGSNPGEGVYLKPVTVTLRDSDIELIELLGGAATRGRKGGLRPNRSAGIRELADHYRSTS